MKQPGKMAWLRLLVGCLVALPVLGAVPRDRAVVEYEITSWETGDGLPENSATAVAQTADGYLWFGTFNGLVRFNGSDFTVFNPDNTPELPSLGIVSLYADRRGRLWISTYEGLVVRDGEGWRQWQSADGWTGDIVRTFTERPDGALLLTTFDGKLFEWANGRFTELPIPPGEAGQGYFGCVDEAGRWWAVQNRFIGHWEGGRWVAMVDPPELAGDAVGCAPARDGGMWLLLGRELRKLRRGLEVMRIDLSEAPGGVWSLSEDSRGNVWIATYNHGFCRVTLDGTMTRWDEAGGMADSGRCAFEDREGNLWLGTSGHGLARLIPKRFRYFELMGGRRGLVIQSVSAHPGGGVWAASYGHGLLHVTDTSATNVPVARRGRRHSLPAKRSGGRCRPGLGRDLGKWIEGGGPGRDPAGAPGTDCRRQHHRLVQPFRRRCLGERRQHWEPPDSTARSFGFLAPLTACLRAISRDLPKTPRARSG